MRQNRMMKKGRDKNKSLSGKGAKSQTKKIKIAFTMSRVTS